MKRLANDHSMSFVFEIVLKLSLVDGDFAAPRLDEDSGGCAFAPSGPVILNRFCHYALLSLPAASSLDVDRASVNSA
jgi:hypothetical protein